MMITQNLSDNEVGILIICVIACIIFAKEIKEFISFMLMLLAGIALVVCSWIVYGGFAALAFCIRMVERFQK